MGEGAAVKQHDDARRPDIDGLRGLTMAAVVAFHAWPARVPGGFVGVDVFFVLSGFLITGLLLAELARATPARIDLPRFYARRARRLLPASVLVVVTTVLTWWWIGPISLRHQLTLDAIASTLFGANIRFAVVANDYFSDDTASPLLHMWSLGVEEQFYLLWPLLLWAAWRVARGRTIRVALLMAALVVASATAAAVLTDVDPPWAFFGAPTRAWQLGAGALLAVTRARLSGPAAHASGLIGAVLVAVSVFTLGGEIPYPGWWAFLPVTGTVLVLWAGPTSWTGRVFSLAPLRMAGNLSYSWYLWHWPVLQAVSVLRDHAPGDLDMGLGVLASGALAALTYRFVENPLRYARQLQPPRRGLAFGAALILLSLVVAVGGWSAARPKGPRGVLAARPVPDQPGRWSILDGLVLDMTTGARSRPATIAPDPQLASNDNGGKRVLQCITDRRQVRIRECTLGNKNAPRMLALVGDSHAAQWLSAWDLVGQSEGWRVVPLLKTACPIGDLPTWNRLVGGPYPQCDGWRRRVDRRLAELRPDVIVVATRADYFRINRDGAPMPPEDSADEILASFQRVVRGWQAYSPRVIFLADTPAPAFKVPHCLVDSGGPERCTFPLPRRGPLFGGNEPWLRAMKQLGVEVVDLNHHVCPDDARCPAVLDNVVVYRDGDHLTATFATTLAWHLARALDPP